MLTMFKSNTLFCVLDLKDGFWYVKLYEKSLKVYTFTTPFGRYFFIRLPLRISSAPEVFQRKIIEAFSDIYGMIFYINNPIISGVTELE